MVSLLFKRTFMLILRDRYPHEMFLSQGRVAGKKKAGALKK